MIYGDNPVKNSYYNDALGLSSYVPNLSAIRQSGNRYVYCSNNPIMYADPSGNWEIIINPIKMLFTPYAARAKFAVASLVYNSSYSVTGFIYGQRNANVTNMRFGGSTVGYSGCEAIAVYNAMLLLGKNVSFHSVIFEFDLNGAYFLPLIGGTFGGNYKMFGDYFRAHRIKATGTSNKNTFNSWAQPGGVYILTFWNDANDITKGIHTVAASYDGNTYTVYNRWNNDTAPRQFDSVDAILYNGSFIYGWMVG